MRSFLASTGERHCEPGINKMRAYSEWSRALGVKIQALWVGVFTLFFYFAVLRGGH